MQEASPEKSSSLAARHDNSISSDDDEEDDEAYHEVAAGSTTENGGYQDEQLRMLREIMNQHKQRLIGAVEEVNMNSNDESCDSDDEEISE